MFTNNDLTLDAAKKFDTEDKLNSFREKFNFPKDESGKELLYFYRPFTWTNAKANSGIYGS